MTKRLRAGGFVRLTDDRAKPASEESQRLFERALRTVKGGKMTKRLRAGGFVRLTDDRAKPLRAERALRTVKGGKMT